MYYYNKIGMGMHNQEDFLTGPAAPNPKKGMLNPCEPTEKQGWSMGRKLENYLPFLINGILVLKF